MPESLLIFAILGLSLAGMAACLATPRKSPSIPGSPPPLRALTLTDLLATAIVVAFYSLLCIASQSPRQIPKDPTPDLTPLIVSSLITILFAAPFIILLLTAPRWKNFWKSRPTHPLWTKLTAVVVCLVATWACLIAYDNLGINSWILKITSGSPEQDIVALLRNGPLNLKIAIAFQAVLIAPIVEEFLFRGLVYSTLKSFSRKPLVSALSVSLFFGVIHGTAVTTLPLAIFSLFLIALLEYSRSLTFPILAHMAFNLVTVISQFSESPRP